MSVIFRDRADAGRQLAQPLRPFRGTRDLLVLGIPRGGVVVAAEVARALGAPLDLWCSHKIGAPHNPELAIGSVAVTGDVQIDTGLVAALGVSRAYLEAAIGRERSEIARRLACYCGARRMLQITGKLVVLVDDGIATGSTTRAALQSLRTQNPAQVILAVPVAPAGIEARLGPAADKVIVIHSPGSFHAVGEFYEKFDQTTDEEVIRLLGNVD